MRHFYFEHTDHFAILTSSWAKSVKFALRLALEEKVRSLKTKGCVPLKPHHSSNKVLVRLSNI